MSECFPLSDFFHGWGRKTRYARNRKVGGGGGNFQNCSDQLTETLIVESLARFKNHWNFNLFHLHRASKTIFKRYMNLNIKINSPAALKPWVKLLLRIFHKKTFFLSSGNNNKKNRKNFIAYGGRGSWWKPESMGEQELLAERENILISSLRDDVKMISVSKIQRFISRRFTWWKLAF